jgi:hypothetical protein
MQRSKLLIGIDPGVNTGFAAYDPIHKTLDLQTFQLHRAFIEVTRLMELHDLEVVIEDPNLWTHFQNSKNAKAKLQGAGSVKRDFSAWRDFLNDWKIPFTAVRPDKTRNSYADDETLFTKITGYTKRCSKHARVAALLVYKN